MRPDSQTKATFVVTPSAIGLRKARLAAPVRCQYSESHHEIKNVPGRGQHDYSGVPRLGLIRTI